MRKAPIVDILVVTLAAALCVSCGMSPPKLTSAQLNGTYTNGPFNSVSPFIKVGLQLNGSTLSGFSGVVGNGPPCLREEADVLSLNGTVSDSHLHWDVTDGVHEIYSFDGTAHVSGNQVQQITGTLTLVACPSQSVVFSRSPF